MPESRTSADSPSEKTEPVTPEPLPGSAPGSGGTEQPTTTAAEELADLLIASRTSQAPPPQEPEIELAADNDDATVDWWVTGPAIALILAVVAWGLSAPDSFASVADSALAGLLNGFGWAFVFFSTVFVIFVLVIAGSKFGLIKLGQPDEEPEFSTMSWFAMMFAAGMGIGLMFYGASEPLTFYRDGVPGRDKHEVGTAMAQSLFHWTLHPWAIYAIVGLAIAYSTYRIGRPQLLSAAFIPVIGERLAHGWLGKVIDVASIIATVFGTACSLGLGALQIRAGLNASGLVDNPSMAVVVGIVSVLTLAFLMSAISGVGKGIQYLSNINMVLAAVLAIFVFVLGPTVTMLNLLPSSIGTYLAEFFEMAGRTAVSANGNDSKWLSSWTMFYWAWWISWSPFVGMFIARISRGRTIREFCLTVMLVPAGVSVVWFAIFGGTAITLEQDGASIWRDGSAENQLFSLLHTLPGGKVAGVVAMVLLATFFITSADSASTVMGSMSQRGRATASPRLSAMWGLATAIIGLTLLLSGHGASALTNLQNVTIIAASPFLLVLVALMFAIVKGLREDVIYVEYREHQEWQRRLARERRLHREQQEMERLRRRMHLRRRHPHGHSQSGSRESGSQKSQK